VSKDSTLEPHRDEELSAVEEGANDWQPDFDPRTGWVLNPALPCTKAEGLCTLRTKPGSSFHCIFKPLGCTFRNERHA